MPHLVIKKDEKRKNELSAYLDGVEVPFIKKVIIESHVGDSTLVHITAVVYGKKEDDSSVTLEQVSFTENN